MVGSAIWEFAKKYGGVQNAKELAKANQPVYDKPTKKEGLIDAVRRYALTEFPTKFSPNSSGYGTARSNVSLDSLRDVLDSGKTLDAKLYDFDNKSYGADLLPSIAEPAVSSNVMYEGLSSGVDPALFSKYSSGLETKLYDLN